MPALSYHLNFHFQSSTAFNRLEIATLYPLRIKSLNSLGLKSHPHRLPSIFVCTKWQGGHAFEKGPVMLCKDPETEF